VFGVRDPLTCCLGTPLQNNARELFNLLQFLEPETIKAADLEEKYLTLTDHNLPQLHEMLRPFFLRRLKKDVLKFMPPMAQVIIPVSMTNVQKKLYQSILERNPALIRAITTGNTLKSKERYNLNNILMQLRKVLCHPFMYSQTVEERTHDRLISHRNLVEASAKLRLLEIMLPKLQERGHRVLIFSQFLGNLDIIEDFLEGLGMEYLRLDGNTNSITKQKRIDAYNAPDSKYFAFLLSTRAGGVGINLATADTCIIMDPDFNPHQDIQALSRCHRIGQKKKVLVFHLMGHQTVEEKIMFVGKNKLKLDHVVIEQMEEEKDEIFNVEDFLRHGAAALYNDSAETIRYDSDSVDKLLDRSQIEETKADEDGGATNSFSFARVWANDKGDLGEELEEKSDTPLDPSAWDKILEERENAAKEEAARRATTLGRGQRARNVSNDI
jgi:chromodomain-helicase-DNA-binding protein 4